MDVTETPFVDAGAVAARTKTPREVPAARTGGLSGQKRATLAKRTVAPAPAASKKKKGVAVEPVKVKKPRRFSEPVRMFRACNQAMKETTLNVPRAVVARLIREITDELPTDADGIRWKESAKFVLHHALEAYAIEFLSKVNVLASHAKRVGPKAIDAKVLLALESCTGGNVVMNGEALGKLETQVGRTLYER